MRRIQGLRVIGFVLLMAAVARLGAAPGTVEAEYAFASLVEARIFLDAETSSYATDLVPGRVARGSATSRDAPRVLEGSISTDATDASLAVSDRHLAVVAGGVLHVFDRDGTRAGPPLLIAAGLASHEGCDSPGPLSIRYEPTSARFIVAAIGSGTTLCVAMSDDSDLDVSRGWTVVALDLAGPDPDANVAEGLITAGLAPDLVLALDVGLESLLEKEPSRDPVAVDPRGGWWHLSVEESAEGLARIYLTRSGETIFADGFDAGTIAAWSDSIGLVNQPPVLAPIGDQTVDLGSTLVLQLAASDPDGNLIRFGAMPVPLPSSASLDALSGRFELSPAEGDVGTFAMTFSADDGRAIDTETVSITVNGPAMGAATSVVGRVLDTNDFTNGIETPVVGATIRIIGDATATTSAADGSFVLSDIPSGTQVLDIDTTSAVAAPDGSPYAGFREAIDLIDGVVNDFDRPFFLPRIDMASLTPVMPATTTVVTNPTLGVTLSVPPHTAKNPDGTDFTGELSISLVPDSLAPVALPEILGPSMLLTIQPVGVTFDSPVPIELPNTDQLTPGSHAEIWSLDAATGSFGVVGMARVDSSGTRVETISGGIRSASWHAFMPPQPGNDPRDQNDDNQNEDLCDDCNSGSQTAISTGHLTIRHDLATYRSLDVIRGLSLAYTSATADPHPIVNSRLTVAELAAVPNLVSTRLEVAGIDQGERTFTSTTGLSESTDETLRVSSRVTSSNLPTGYYPYRLHLSSHYQDTRISSIQVGGVLLHNRKESVFGAGWGIDGLQQIVPPVNPSDPVILTDGNGSIQRFSVRAEGSLLFEDTFDDENRGEGIGLYADFRNWDVEDLSGNPLEVMLVGNDVDDTWPGNGLYTKLEGDVQPLDNGLVLRGPSLTFSPGSYRLWFDVATPSAMPTDDRLDIWFTTPAGGIASVAQIDFPAGEVSGFETITCDIEVTSSRRPSPQQSSPQQRGGRPCAFLLSPGTYELRFLRPLVSEGQPVLGVYLDDIRVFSGQGDTIYQSPRGDTSTLTMRTDGTFVRLEKDGHARAFDAEGRQVAWIERNGNTTSYGYDALGRLRQITDPANRVTTLAYQDGHIESITDPAGRVTSFAHDSGGRLVTITDPDGTRRDFAYDADDRLTTQTSKRGFETTYFYNFAGQNILVERPDGTSRGVTPLALAGLGAPSAGLGTQSSPLPFARVGETFASFTDGRGNTTRFITNRFGGITDRIDALGGVSKTDYDPGGRPSSITSPEGITTEFDYDARGNLLRLRQAVGTPIERQSELFYDPVYSEIVRAVGPAGGTEIYDRDAVGNIEFSTDPVGEITAMTWDGEGRLTSVTDPRGNTTEMRYGVDGNLEEIENALGTITHLDRDAAGNVTTVTEAYGTPDARTWSRAYDALNRLTSTTDPLGNTTSYGYDDVGNLTSVTAPSGLVTTATFDVENRLATLTTPHAGTRVFTYDDNGNLETATNALDETTTFVHDALDRRVQVIDPEGGITTTFYDADGRVDAVENARGATTRYVFDELGRLTSRTDPLLEVETFEYDEPRSLVETYTDPEGQVATHVYDALGRRTGTTTVDDVISFAYDPAGNLERAADSDSEIVYTYDALNRVATETTTLGTDAPVVLTHVYHPRLGMRTSVLDSLGGMTGFAFDDANRLESVTSAAGQTVDLDWDSDGRLTGITRPNGITTTYGYHGTTGRLDTLEHSDASGALFAASYIHDAIGRISDIVEAGQTKSLQYDSRGRLTDAGTVALPESYTYDDVGNRITSHLSSIHAHDDADQLLSDARGTYTYDKNGNLRTITETASGDVTTFNFDALNRVVGAILPGGENVSYRHDALGRRFEKVVDGTTTRYLYDGQNILIERDGTGTVAARYAHGALIDQPLSMSRGGVDAYYLADHLGSIRFLVDGTSATINQYTYDAFGRVLTASEGVANPYTYTAREHDPETGTLHYRARSYSPAIGRFLSRDPIGFAGGDVNLYAYVRNSPVELTDPSGLIISDVIDWGSAGFSLYNFWKCPGWGTFGAFVLDGLGAVAPFVPAPGTIRHASNIVDAVSDARNADNVADAADSASDVANLAGGAHRLPDNALVCRGGTCRAELFENGSGVTVDPVTGILDDVSVNSAPGLSLQELTVTIPHKQIGVTTVGDVRAAGGNVVPSPTPNNPHHCTLCGVTAQQAESLFTPTAPNPNRQ